jgi:hypothetical protein
LSAFAGGRPEGRADPAPAVPSSSETNVPESLLVVCATAFIAVIVLLTVLAAAIRLVTRLFPPPRTVVDAALAAAIAGAVATAIPGARVTRIEEESQR